MKQLLLAVLLLSGCSSLQNAGTSEYMVRPFKIGEETLCCEVSIKNGKELHRMTAKIVKKGDDYTIDIDMQGVTAFKGQSISAEAGTNIAGSVAGAVVEAIK